MDLLGIVIVTVGTFIPGIYYIFFCELALRRFHWFIVITSGSGKNRSRFGLEYMLNYLLELCVYSSGVFLYAFRIAERFAPGRFDIWGSSHEIFHVFILCAMYIQTYSLMQAFTACHILEICGIQQAAHQLR
ncbi:hypothetical protein VHEMI07624 [[Torrubiella] hemipterigena]|uniref:Uncharacterized protein n=1 Tax=[Torrubiella] hemipterigena TaxID=1531966 RepID=A0A0A1TN93_9HYPO|nr:hypothetical protein VHEMI07624 [[Torrubiella] hemipterigena]